MQLLNQLKTKVEEKVGRPIFKNPKNFRNIFFWGLMLCNYLLFAILMSEQSELNSRLANVQIRETEVSNREKACFVAEEYISIKEDALSEFYDDVYNRSMGLYEYESYVESELTTLNQKLTTLSEQQDFVNSLAEELSSSEDLYIPTPDEIDNLNKLVFAEAGNQSYEGKVAVAEVVFNRIRNQNFPDTINDVIFEKSQFAPCYDGKNIRLGNGKKVTDENVSYEVKQAVFEAWSGSNLTETLLQEEAYSKGIYDSSYWKGGALYFANPNAVDNSYRLHITSAPVKVEIEDHLFRRKN